MTHPLAASDATIDCPISPERRLMVAVLLTAILDASGNNTGTATQRDRDVVRGTALGWIKDAGPDFHEVCELAGFDAQHVRHCALHYIDSGTKRPGISRQNHSHREPRPCMT